MELEFHQIDLRFESLRRRDPHRERLLAVSMGAIGQQTPVVVVAQADGKPILVDGFKRLRALKALRFDVVRATCWDLPEQEALLLGCLMRTATSESPFEQGWLLRELRVPPAGVRNFRGELSRCARWRPTGQPLPQS